SSPLSHTRTLCILTRFPVAVKEGHYYSKGRETLSRNHFEEPAQPAEQSYSRPQPVSWLRGHGRLLGVAQERELAHGRGHGAVAQLVKGRFPHASIRDSQAGHHLFLHAVGQPLARLAVVKVRLTPAHGRIAVAVVVDAHQCRRAVGRRPPQ